MTDVDRTEWICEDSVCRTIDAVEAAAFDDRDIGRTERERIARWLAARQGLPGSKSGTFAGFPAELRDGFVAFTGERFTHASARHILGEEACRALRWLDVADPTIRAALDRADAGLMDAVALAEHDPRHPNPGVYCCGKCSVGMWRNVLSGGLDRRDERLARGVEFLSSHRSGRGRWRVFPFWYTVLALAEMGTPEAAGELTYASPVLERAAAKTSESTGYEERRRVVARRALGSL